MHKAVRPPLPHPDVPSDQPFLVVTANITNVRSDGCYNFDTIEARLDPPISYFYESFNGMIWTVSLFDGFLAQLSYVIPPVIEPNPQVRTPVPYVYNFLYFKWFNGELYSIVIRKLSPQSPYVQESNWPNLNLSFAVNLSFSVSYTFL